ncbi:CvfD/Ygs/GSP13 family RNA-binding post-transcriptional regulator [Liquorilactobacillus cacaonum]|uniref:Polyribonucleotide nucleotidyltransferase n=1 Tax=Liquorilactobacillus cacaonum DSM 21116 TaxID=1423729 RepID=A0A0R2CJ14_9LACO|nr:CvfD/Ygs/GSP13 family RNA-binding post-transcriptional regulator [Liquorilactobacillus cacaonum]KRM91585.1 polyribonucleotide nucleotidyltransferase [Liquorilactobacillus cacaonum DSM 21116]
MDYKIGSIVEGKVTGIQTYGAFVSLDSHMQGLIHISECRHGYVADIHHYLKTNQRVKVMIIDIDEYTGKISLSLRCLKDAFVNIKDERVRCNHKHYWTNYKVNDGFKPIESHLNSWVGNALEDIERK